MRVGGLKSVLSNLVRTGVRDVSAAKVSILTRLRTLSSLFFFSFGSLKSSPHQDEVSLSEHEPESLENFELSSGFILDKVVVQEKMELDLKLPPSSTTTSTITNPTTTTPAAAAATATTSTDGNNIRRSNSVPLINGFRDTSQVFQADTLRVRRSSTTFMGRHGLLFLPSVRTSASRLHQIKQEEGIDLVNREAMHEREVHNAIQICRSWEENFNLNDNNLEKPSSVKNVDIIPVTPVASLIKRIGKKSQTYPHC